MELDIYQIDAFASKPFEGNPAAVVPLSNWLPDAQMQQIAAENNLSETAFYVNEAEGYRIRWFTPADEVPLCGHATLASAYVIFRLNPDLAQIRFQSLSGPLIASRDSNLITMDFPVSPVIPFEAPSLLAEALGTVPTKCVKSVDGRRYIAMFDDHSKIHNLTPDISKLMALESMTVTVTSTSPDYDFISRVFAPKLGIPEDPVTGAVHTSLIPFWAEKLEKDKLHAKQVSARGGELHCELKGDRAFISGKAVEYLRGKICIPD